MAFNGYFALGGMEIANRYRLNTYAENLAPGIVRDCNCACEGLPLALGEEYATPLIDDAPWVDVDAPQSLDFLGFMPMEVQGLDDSSRETTYTQLATDGGAVLGRRHAAKEVRIRGLLVATTEEAVDYGQTWLNSVLRGSVGGECGPGDDLCYFVSCPEAEPASAPVRSPLDLSAFRTTDGGTWDGETFTATRDEVLLRRNLALNPAMVARAGLTEYGSKTANVNHLNGQTTDYQVFEGGRTWMRLVRLDDEHTAGVRFLSGDMDADGYYSGSVVLKAATPAAVGQQVNVRLHAAGQGYLSPVNQVTLTADPQTYLFTGNTTQPGGRVSLYIYPTGTDEFMATDVLIEKVSGSGVTAGPYFDGRDPSVLGVHHRWIGAPHASMSDEYEYSEATPALVLPRLSSPLPCAGSTWELELVSEVQRDVVAEVWTNEGLIFQTVAKIGPEPTTIWAKEVGENTTWAEVKVYFSTEQPDYNPFLHGRFRPIAGGGPLVIHAYFAEATEPNIFDDALFDEDGSEEDLALFAEWDAVGSGTLLTYAQFVNPAYDPLSYALISQALGDGGGSFTVLSAHLNYQEPGDPKECADQLVRRLRGVYSIEGPKVIRSFNTSKGWFREVDFTLGAMTPWRYSLDIPIVTSEADGTITAHYPGARVERVGGTLAECPNPRRIIIADPDCQQPPLPPKVQAPPSSCKPTNFSPDSRFSPDVESNMNGPVNGLRTFLIHVPGTALPAFSDVVPVMRLTPQTRPVRHVRVRFIQTPWAIETPDMLDPCSVCGDFIIDYIPQGGTLVLDGMREEAWFEFISGEQAPAGHLLSGPTSDSTFTWPVLSCGVGYVVVLDILDDNETLDTSFSIALRE